MESFAITRINENSRESAQDLVVEEISFSINLAEKELVTLLCSPFDLEDLARGFLFTSGIIRDISEIKRITIDSQRWSCHIEVAGRQGKNLMFKQPRTSLKINNAAISKMMIDFQNHSEVYLKTGGTHSAALADESGILVFKEDIGRHNAIDKVIGYALLRNDAFEDRILITSGRITSEVVFKVKNCGMPIIVSCAAVTNQAVRLAREMDLTLVGFARGSRMNVYSAEEKIL